MISNKYNRLFFSLLFLMMICILSSCKKDIPAPAVVNNSLSEQFNSLDAAEANGWVFINNSRSLGITTWQAGDGSMFPGYTTDAAASDYVSIDASCANIFDSSGNFNPNTVISAWMITPALTIKNGDVLNFYTRTTDTYPIVPERLELRMNPSGTGIDVGNDSSSVGEFTNLLGVINPDLAADGYPNTWTGYQYTVAGFPAPTKTRFAFRYYKPVNTIDGASYYYQLGYIGIDDFTFNSL